MTETKPPPPGIGMERAVEAALPIIRTARCGSNELNWCDAGMDCRCRVATTILIAAADRARGRSYITWRRPEEYEQDPEGKSSRRVLVYVRESHPSDPSYAPEYVVLHWKFRPLTDHMIAWADMPAVDAWSEAAPTTTNHEQWPPAHCTARSHCEMYQGAGLWCGLAENSECITRSKADTLARTATDGEGAPGHAAAVTSPDKSMFVSGYFTDRILAGDNPVYDPVTLARTATGGECAPFLAPSGTTRETPGAAVLAGGAKSWRCPTCDSPRRELHPAMQHGGEVQVCSDPWHVAVRAPVDRVERPPFKFDDDAETSEPTRLSDLELRVIALERRPALTTEKDALLRFIARAWRMGPEYEALGDAAFPERKS